MVIEEDLKANVKEFLESAERDFIEEKFAKTNFSQRLQTSHEEHFENSSKKRRKSELFKLL